MRTISLLIIILSTIYANCQTDKDYTLAHVGYKIHGVYIFIQADPIQNYTHIGTVKVSLRDLKRKTFENAIDKAKDHYPYFNGMIFRYDDLSRADLIKFDDMEVTRKGIRLNEKVTYTKRKKVIYGKVIAFINQEYSKVQYIDEYGDEKVEEIPFILLTPIDEDLYNTKIVEIKSHIKNFDIKDHVIWIEGAGPTKESYTGYVIGLSKNGHKASVEYQVDGETHVKKIDILDLSLLDN